MGSEKFDSGANTPVPEGVRTLGSMVGDYDNFDSGATTPVIPGGAMTPGKLAAKLGKDFEQFAPEADTSKFEGLITSEKVVQETSADGASLESNNPKPWDATKLSRARKLHIIVAGFACTFNGNLGSSMPSGAQKAIAAEFSVTNGVYLILLNSLYMVGYVIGPLIVGPLSELIGRKPVLITSFILYLTFMLACSGAPNFPALLIFRMLCGFGAAAPTTVISGLYADILDDPSERGWAMTIYMTITTCGPLIGPIISGFSSPASWRWPFWAAGILALPTLPLILTIPETFAPVLQNRAARRQIKSGLADEKSVEPPVVLNPRKIFVRPFVLLFTEPILFLTAMYLTLAYALFFLMFQAYPIVFQEHYGLSPGVAALAYIPTGVGAILSLPIFYFYNSYYNRSAQEGKPWAVREIYRRLPLACIAAPCMVISLFWLGWGAWDSVSPFVPALSGIPWGIGFQLIFMGMSNYITDVYRELSASAQAASSTTRSIGAVLLPLAARSMYDSLGTHWAPSLLGFVALVMGVIPFLFIRYGDAMAARSKSARDLYGYSSS